MPAPMGVHSSLTSLAGRPVIPPSDNITECMSGTIYLVAEAIGCRDSVIWAGPL